MGWPSAVNLSGKWWVGFLLETSYPGNPVQGAALSVLP